MIYAIGASLPNEVSFIKFGKAKNPRERLAMLQTGNPLKLRIYAEVDWPDSYEGLLHRRFRAKRACGEWFKVDDDLNSFMNLMVYAPAAAKKDLEAVEPLPVPTEYDSLLQCGIIHWETDEHSVTLYLPDRHCVDMYGAIAYSRRLNPNVTFIRTVAGLRRDTAYGFSDGGWKLLPDDGWWWYVQAQRGIDGARNFIDSYLHPDCEAKMPPVLASTYDDAVRKLSQWRFWIKTEDGRYIEPH